MIHFGIGGWKWLLGGGDISANVEKSVMRRAGIFFQVGNSTATKE